MPTTITEEAPVTVAVCRSALDGTLLVQVDTEEGVRLRVNLNDAALWDGNPEEDKSHQEVLYQLRAVLNGTQSGFYTLAAGVEAMALIVDDFDADRALRKAL